MRRRACGGATAGRWSTTSAGPLLPPIVAPPVVISARFLSEDERVLIGDLLRAVQSVRSSSPGWGVARPPSAGRSAATARRVTIGRAPHGAAKTGPRHAITRFRAAQIEAALEPGADQPRAAVRVPRPSGAPSSQASGAHVATAVSHAPCRRTSTGREECLAGGDDWVELWLCQSCGSGGLLGHLPQRARASPLRGNRPPHRRSVAPGPRSRWCYVHHRIV